MGDASMMRAATLSVDPDDDPRATGPAGAGVRFWAALAVAGIAVAGFGGVVAYGYLAYGDRGEQVPAPLVKAETRPLKIRPDDPGGLNVEHKDKEVFNAGRDPRTPGAGPGAVREVLLPPPEMPLPKPAPMPVVAAPAVSVTPAAAPETPAAVPPPASVAAALPYPPPLPPPAAPSVRSPQRSLAATPGTDAGAALARCRAADAEQRLSGVLELYADRIALCKAGSVLPADWDGVWTLAGKDG